MSEQFVIFRDKGAIASDESKWVEGTISQTGEPYIDMPAKLMYTGTHKGVKYDEAKFDRIVSNFRQPTSERDWSVPLQLDHDETSRSTVGNLRKVWRTGKELWATTRFIGDESVRKAKNGLWRLLSPSVFPVSERLRETSVTPFPHLTGTATFSETTESEDEPMADKPKTEDKAPVKETTKPEAPVAHSDNALIAQMRQEFNDRTEALLSRVEASEAKNKELEQAVRFAQVTKEVDKFTDANKTTAAMRELELDLVQTFSDEQLEKWRLLKEAQPVVIDTNVYGSQDPEQVAQFKADKAAEADGSKPTDKQVEDIAKLYA